MKKTIRKFVVLSSVGLCLGGVVKPLVVSAQVVDDIGVQANADKGDYWIKIIDPYIVDSFYAYTIQNKEELRALIGDDRLRSLEERLAVANSEKLNSLERDAVSDLHIAILRQTGASVESLWWGKRIKTYNRDMAIKVRQLATAFTGNIGTAGLVTTMTTMGLSFVPGLGAAAMIAGGLIGTIAWADSTTWNTVSGKVADEIDRGHYDLTIDINAWNMEVKVY